MFIWVQKSATLAGKQHVGMKDRGFIVLQTPFFFLSFLLATARIISSNPLNYHCHMFNIRGQVSRSFALTVQHHTVFILKESMCYVTTLKIHCQSHKNTNFFYIHTHTHTTYELNTCCCVYTYSNMVYKFKMLKQTDFSLCGENCRVL